MYVRLLAARVHGCSLLLVCTAAEFCDPRFQTGARKGITYIQLAPSHERVSMYLRLQDMQQSGAPLAMIMAAGEWRSRAILKYLDLCELEKDIALEAAMHSDEEFID